MAKRYYTEDELIFAPFPKCRNSAYFLHPRFRDLTGVLSGRLTVIGYAGNNPESSWFCRCSCGSIVKITSTAIRHQRTKSCGCLVRDLMRTKKTKHGKSQTYEYGIWSGMRKRCNNPKAKAFERYGGRGITVCKQWDSFENFFIDMGPRPSPDHSIERIENDKGYCPDNCIWAKPRAQANNTRGNRTICIDGVSKTLAQWCGGSSSHLYKVAHHRITRGWCAHCAITIPVGNIGSNQMTANTCTHRITP